MSELLPCKKHGDLPRLVEIKLDHLNQAYQFPQTKLLQYVCDKCESEKELQKIRPLIEDWNKRQS